MVDQEEFDQMNQRIAVLVEVRRRVRA